jgi:hypothetical protein
MKKYVVINRTRIPGYFEIVNKQTKSLEDIFYKEHPTNDRKLNEKKVKPLIFNTWSEANEYRIAQDEFFDGEWDRWSTYLRREGLKKGKWRVESYDENTFFSQKN